MATPMFTAFIQAVSDVIKTPAEAEDKPSVQEIPDVQAEEIELIETGLRTFVIAKKVKNMTEGVKEFFDEIYTGKVPNMQPQLPREKVEEAVEKVKETKPALWMSLAESLGLSPE